MITLLSNKSLEMAQFNINIYYSVYVMLAEDTNIVPNIDTLPRFQDYHSNILYQMMDVSPHDIFCDNILDIYIFWMME